MKDFLILHVDDVSDMSQNITRLAVNCGGTRIGAMLTRKTKAPIFWCHDHNRQGLTIDANMFTAEVMIESLETMENEGVEDKSMPELPTEFKAYKWISWNKKFKNYLFQVKGRNGTPLAYIIRKLRGSNAPDFQGPEEEQLLQ